MTIVFICGKLGVDYHRSHYLFENFRYKLLHLGFDLAYRYRLLVVDIVYTYCVSLPVWFITIGLKFLQSD